MASPLPMKHFLILGMVAVFLFVSFVSAHNTFADGDTEPAEGVYGKKDKSVEYKGSYGKPKKDKNDDENKYGKYKPRNDDDDDGKQYKGTGPRKDDKGHPAHGGYDEPKEGPKGDYKQSKPAPHTPAEVVPKSISVEGVVSCQDCKYVGGDSLTDAKPIAGAKVKLVCQTGPRYKSSFYATAVTDANGFFLISVPRFDFKKFTPADNCAVFLVSSPLKECNIATDINMAKTGGPLRPIPTFAPSENLMYSVGPFAYAPKQCSPKPPTGYIPPPAAVPPPAYGGGSHY